jgi:toxin-antitoxin system, antitoxin component, hicB family
MKSRLLYPCIVKKEDGIFYANFLDFEGCFTDGETLEEVVINAKDVLSGTLFTMAKHNIQFPSSENKKIDLKDGEFLIYIDVWISPILEKAKNQSIKKTLTIPKWLNDEAEKHSLNFSNILQTALKETLGL